MKETLRQWVDIKKQLPPQFKVIIDTLDTEEEQILYVLSMIAATSSLFTKIHGIYGRQKVYSNLFFICQAPPASGKSLMASARTALGKIHEELIKESRLNQTLYKEQVVQAIKSKLPAPVKPPFTILFMPGNCTSSKMIQHIQENGLNPILILETEVSTLATANKSQYGDFSDIVRKAFQGETVSYTRKFNDEFVEVNEPKLAIVLSGTPDQVTKLIGTPEDGTFSRFLFYSFTGLDEWKEMNCKDCVNLTDLLVSQQEEYCKLWKYFSDRDVLFELTQSQWEEVNGSFKEEYNLAKLSGNVYAKGAVKRHGLILFKMCLVLTALRAFNESDKDRVIECADRDFEIAKYLVSISLESSMDVLEQLPKPHYNLKTKDKKAELLDRLNEKFSRGEAVEIGKEFRVSTRTVDRWLETMLTSGKIYSQEYGFYNKS